MEFTGCKGLRQGDLMSPLLFVLVMEYLARVLQWYAKNSDLKFHPSCRKVGLSALCFTDDLILLCKANFKAFGSLLKGFNIFSETNGLVRDLLFIFMVLWMLFIIVSKRWLV